MEPLYYSLMGFWKGVSVCVCLCVSEGGGEEELIESVRSSALNTDGEVELDAIIMDGRTLASGAVSCVKNIANPVSLARAVMEKTAHIMLTGRGANMFAESIGIVTVPTETLVTEYEMKEWEKHKNYVTGVMEDFNSQAHDTVGAVAVDCAGNVACATSTGGIRNKMVGRVGDSPIIGSGGYADNFTGAVSCTGHGESILKVTLARLILSHIEQGKIPFNAVLHYMLVIVVYLFGNINEII
uniref:Isoaspartyl peptidase/L-asparaginase n=1 Tax=Lates calcarifer TaxID=8187 RepID=A0A4W6FV87_LATCA